MRLFNKLSKIDNKSEKQGKEKSEKSKTRLHDESSSPCGPSVNDFISRTKARQKEGLKPSGPELIAYARYLGIDPVVDHDLLWIAEEALAAPLPSEWTEHFDSSDRVFYYNATTHVSSWTHPLEHLYRDTYKTIVHFRSATSSPQEKVDGLHKLQQECHQMEREVQTEIKAWTEHEDVQGHKFYFNNDRGKSSWTDPRPAKCHILYLKMKMIRILCQQAGVNLTDAKAGGESRFEPMSLSPREDGERASKRSRADKEDRREKGRSEDADTMPSDDIDYSMPPAGMDGQKKKKKKKEKKNKDRSADRSGLHDDGGMFHSMSEPAGMGVPDPMGLDPLGSMDAGPRRAKAGLRLEPLNHAALPGNAFPPVASALSSSVSVPTMPIHPGSQPSL